MGFVRKVVEEKRASGSEGCLLGDGLDLQYPAISEYLSLGVFEDGSCRQVATVMLFQEEDVWKVCLNDRQNERSLWAAGLTVSLAFDALETLVASGAGIWRRSGQTTRYKGKK